MVFKCNELIFYDREINLISQKTKKNMKRAGKEPYLLVKIGRKVRKIKTKNILSRYGATACIRIHKKEFKNIDSKKKYYTHFNLQKTGHKKGRTYVITKIVKRGFYTKKKEVKPVLSFDDCIIAKCISVKENVSYEKLTKKIFEYSMKNIKNIKQLQRAIISRYGKSMPDLSKKKILSLGVAITTLELKNKN